MCGRELKIQCNSQFVLANNYCVFVVLLQLCIQQDNDKVFLYLTFFNTQQNLIKKKRNAFQTLFCPALKFILYYTNYLLKESMQSWMRIWVFCNFKQRFEQIFKNFLEAGNQLVTFIDIKKPWHLDYPTTVVRVYIIVNGPLGKFIPFFW